MSDPHWTQYMTACLTPIVAIVAVGIAYRQWRTARDKLKLDLFERRLAVYEALQDVCFVIGRVGGSDAELESRLHTRMREAKWLFGPDIGKYVDAVWDKVKQLRTIEEVLQTFPQGEYVAQQHEECEGLWCWMREQEEVIDKMFAPYLSIGL